MKADLKSWRTLDLEDGYANFYRCEWKCVLIGYHLPRYQLGQFRHKIRDVTDMSRFSFVGKRGCDLQQPGGAYILLAN